MGLYDTIHIHSKVFENYKDIFSCPKCSKFDGGNYQTKDFDSAMNDYYLCYDENNNLKIYGLDPPEKENHFVPYSPEELGEFEKVKNDKSDSNKLSVVFAEIRMIEGGYWKDEAFLPENRKKRNMGEYPHQWINFYTCCSTTPKRSCDGFIEIEVKFTDGICVLIRQKVERGKNED